MDDAGSQPSRHHRHTQASKSCVFPITDGIACEEVPKLVGTQPMQSEELGFYTPHQRKPVSDSSYSYGPYQFPLSGFGINTGMEKFPDIEVSGFLYGSALMSGGPPLSISPPMSTVSRTSSVGSTLSPVQTEFASQSDVFTSYTGGNSWSRGPSPLRNTVKALSSPSEASTLQAAGEGEYVCLAPGCEAKFPREKDLDYHVKMSHLHVCLWSDNGPCESSGFATREELNWHVKSEHLLVCPVLGCAESLFSNKDLLDCHIRWVHKDAGSQRNSCESSNLLGTTTMSRSNSLDKPEKAKIKVAKGQLADDKVLKMEMSIGIYKKRCREQLKNVVEKRLRRTNGTTPKTGGSPGVTPRLLESASFPVIWEHVVLPFLIEFIPKWCGPGHTISVLRGNKRDARRVCFMTKNSVSRARKVLIATHVQDLLPENHRINVTFMFSVGEVDRLVWARGLSKAMPDEVCTPRNPFCYISPCMGDSIGAVLPDGDDVSATLGPCLTIGGGDYWLASFHPFVEANQAGTVMIQHPSPDDRDRCLKEKHDALDNVDYKVGRLTATSGYDLKTTRISHDPYWEDCNKEPPFVVMDWTLISALSQTSQANLVRKFPTTATPKQEVPITKMSCVMPGSEVCSTGRTSGHQRGQVCDIPAYLSPSANGTGKGTREWFIEEPYSYDNEDDWIRGGIGVQGDSGAAIVDCDTNALVGTLWGRNKYFGAGPRQTFFTPIFDIFDDIQERCGEQTRPQLPQYLNEADRWPVYPVCKTCFDLREYLDTRRSSRESLMSMIAGVGPGQENDHDLTSVSELATPKANGDQAYWRYTGMEEMGSSFNSVASPAALSTFFVNPQAASPGMSDMRSPYALALNDEDLYENKYGDRGEVVLGKHQPVPVPFVRTNSQQLGKRRRIV